MSPGDRCLAGVAPDGSGRIWRCERPDGHAGYHRKQLRVNVGGDPHVDGPIGATLFWPDSSRYPVEATR